MRYVPSFSLIHSSSSPHLTSSTSRRPFAVPSTVIHSPPSPRSIMLDPSIAQYSTLPLSAPLDSLPLPPHFRPASSTIATSTPRAPDRPPPSRPRHPYRPFLPPIPPVSSILRLRSQASGADARGGVLVSSCVFERGLSDVGSDCGIEGYVSWGCRGWIMMGGIRRVDSV